MAEEPSFTIRLGKIKNNRLLDRVQMVCDVFYEPKAKITKEMIKNKIARQFKIILTNIIKNNKIIIYE